MSIRTILMEKQNNGLIKILFYSYYFFLILIMMILVQVVLEIKPMMELVKIR